MAVIYISSVLSYFSHPSEPFPQLVAKQQPLNRLLEVEKTIHLLELS